MGTIETVMRIFQPPYLDRSLMKPMLIDDEQVAIEGVLLPHRLRFEE